MKNEEIKNIILVDNETSYTTVGLIEDGRLCELYSESVSQRQITGNIYKGRVVNVVDGLQSAFVDIAESRTGFWHINESMASKSDLTDDDLPSDIMAKEGDYVMVQAIKEGTDLKGPKLTSNISIAGHYVVYLYNLDFIGVSGKITNEPLRNRLTDLLKSIAPKGRGFIARTSCLNATDEDIIQEANFLIKAGERIQQRWENADGVSLIHNEGNILYRTIRDMLSDKIDLVVCNNSHMTEDLRQMIDMFCPMFKGDVAYYDREEDIYDYFGIGDDITAIHNPRVELSSGGFLMIEKTEALTAIDVNTGKFLGKDSREETVYKTNLEAVKEIARQLRLRNIGGIIVVDFIDMLDEEHKANVVETLKTELFLDRVKTRVLDMSGLGLVEITRKKVGRELGSVSQNTCPYCGGTGYLLLDAYVSRAIKYRLKNLFVNHDVSIALIFAHPTLASHLIDDNTFSKECSGIWSQKRIYVVPDESLDFGSYRVYSGMGGVPYGATLLS
ncbi:MAG: Rne/Rng family ribonuclease [Clostridia bacterium]|nr:Rne/Rng family ribonuclease [Clostridia bacterium]